MKGKLRKTGEVVELRQIYCDGTAKDINGKLYHQGDISEMFEFSNTELKYIKETMIEKISSVSNKETAEKAFDIINVCQELLREPQFESIDKIVNSKTTSYI